MATATAVKPGLTADEANVEAWTVKRLEDQDLANTEREDRILLRSFINKVDQAVCSVKTPTLRTAEAQALARDLIAGLKCRLGGYEDRVERLR